MQEKVKIFIISLLLASVFFVLGYIIGRISSSMLFLNMENKILSLQNKVLSIDVGLNILQREQMCDTKLIEQIGETVSSIGRYIGTLEDEYGTENEKILLVKEYYNLVLIKYYYLLKDLNSKCDFNYTFILFFYSNDKKYYEKSLEVGEYLDYIVYKYWPKVKVFAIEGKLIDNDIIKYLIEKYNVTTFPTVIINDKIKLENIQGPYDIEKYI